MKNQTHNLIGSMFFYVAFGFVGIANSVNGQATAPSAQHSTGTRAELVERAKQFLALTYASDDTAMRDLSSPLSDAQWAQVRTVLDADRWQTRVARAVFKRFGDAARNEWPEDPDADMKSLTALIEKAPVDIHEATATLGPISPDGSMSLNFARVDGTWKLDLYHAVFWREGRSPEMQVEVEKRRIGPLQKIVDQIDAGDFKSVAEVFKAVQEIQ